MHRRTFVRSLVGACALAPFVNAGPAYALDEAQIGREAYLQLRDDGDILFDSPFYEHLNEVGQIVAEAVGSRYPHPVRFYIVKGDSANAFSVPGGNIYVNEPLLRLAKNRDELGGVLAHESGHMVLHHVAKRIKNSTLPNVVGTLGGILAQVFLGPLGALPANYALDTALTAQDLNVSRHVEAEADEEGARIMASTSGLNPYGLIWFFESLIETYGQKGTFWQRSHPFEDRRIVDLQNLFKASPELYGKYDKTNRRGQEYW